MLALQAGKLLLQEFGIQLAFCYTLGLTRRKCGYHCFRPKSLAFDTKLANRCRLGLTQPVLSIPITGFPVKHSEVATNRTREYKTEKTYVFPLYILLFKHPYY